MSQSTVLLRTPITQTIFFNKGMLLLLSPFGERCVTPSKKSNHFLIYEKLISKETLEPRQGGSELKRD